MTGPGLRLLRKHVWDGSATLSAGGGGRGVVTAGIGIVIWAPAVADGS